MFKNIFNFNNEVPKTEKKPWYESITNSPFKKALMLSLLLSGSPKLSADRDGAVGSADSDYLNENKDKTELVSDSVAVFKDNLESDGKTDFTLQHRFTVKDENGNESFSPWAFIAPVQLDITRTQSFEKKLKIDIPHEYSRLFNSAKEVDPGAQEKLKLYIKKQIQAQLVDDLTTLDPSSISENVLERDNPGALRSGERNFEVENISITGFTSPEGPEYKGPSTIDQQNIDQENISLGKLRAENVRPALIQALKEQGIDINESEVVDFSINSQEIQLSNEERDEVLDIAKRLGISGFNDEEIIFNTFLAFNDNEINDPQAMAKLSKIISTKRTVSIMVHLKGDEKKVFIVPLPLLLLLPLPLLFRRRRNKKSDLGNNFQEPENIKQEITNQETPVTSNNTNNERLLTYEQDEPIFAEAKNMVTNEMIKQTVTVDLFNNIDNEFTMKHGIDYRDICRQIQSLLDTYGPRQLEKIVSDIILDKWSEHDLAVRRASGGFSEDNINKGLDYKNQKEQVAWSIAHARELIGLANAQKASGDDVQGFNNEFIRRYKTLSN